MNIWQQEFNERMGGKTCREVKLIGQQMATDRLISKVLQEQNDKIARSKAMQRVKNYLRDVM